ncbi:multiple sugar transport system substrate-binding protein [Paenibacillus phyllosphaerae]|uniref:Multiple sugar transport system substrate-binding protein n=1 Tax=Paenibacillus phyllosphaerae TaxID=274593 RepID=A0A7W5B3B9_9BACL|nr:extracellular solute-binding protein [Paenibacillus phyllosphaerae]MBB3113660.1 multiple sugar transport system substrate-binding protein [Paenibacillus phyllosphaerae]
MRVSKKSAAALAATLLTTTMLAGCGGDNSAYSMDEEAAGNLKVTYYDESYFFQQYGNLFNAKFPNVEIEVASTNSMFRDGVTDYEKAFDDFIAKENPDVIMVSMDQYAKLVEKDMLLDLESMLTEEDFKSEDLLPGMIEVLREKGNGKLYGLSPSFYGQALYYNKDLFEKYGVPLPQASMSWQEILQLAQRFPTTGSKDDRVYGFYMDYYNLTNLGMQIGGTGGLRYLDPAGTKVSLNTDGWKQAFQLAIDTVNSGAYYAQGMSGENDMPMGGTYESYLSQDKFLSGKAAMTISGSYYLQQLEQAEDNIKDYKKFNLGLSTEPVDPANPTVGSSIGANEIFVINAKTPNAKAAWQLVKYMNGDLAAKLLSRTMNGNLMARLPYLQDRNGVSLEAFYTLKPRTDMINQYENLPQEFYGPFNTVLEKEINSVKDGKKTIDQALKDAEAAAQIELEKAKKAEAERKAAEAKNAGASEGENAETSPATQEDAPDAVSESAAATAS